MKEEDCVVYDAWSVERKTEGTVADWTMVSASYGSREYALGWFRCLTTDPKAKYRLVGECCETGQRRVFEVGDEP